MMPGWGGNKHLGKLARARVNALTSEHIEVPVSCDVCAETIQGVTKGTQLGGRHIESYQAITFRFRDLRSFTFTGQK